MKYEIKLIDENCTLQDKPCESFICVVYDGEESGTWFGFDGLDRDTVMAMCAFAFHEIADWTVKKGIHGSLRAALVNLSALVMACEEL